MSRKNRLARLENLEKRSLLCGLMHTGSGHVLVDSLPADPNLVASPGESDSPPVLASQPPLVPTFNSNPSASDKLFIDFDGDAGGVWGGFQVGETPAFNFEGDANTFTAAEQAQIEYIWRRAAEKFAPFNIDVTTVDPGNLNNGQTLRAVVGGNGSWYGAGVGGVAYVDGYTNGLPNTVWVFSQNYGFNFAGVAETVAHEAGHGYGLQHQSVWSGGTKTNEYNPGTSVKAPIMGNSNSSVRGLWWLGPSSISPAPTAQDDLQILSRPANTFGYRTDDVGNTIGTATAMSGGGNVRTASGLITTTGDVDVFSFTLAAAGPTNVRTDIAGSAFGLVGMLDSRIDVLNSAGDVVASTATSALGESLNFNATGGTYYIAVKSQGEYGDVGTYTLTVTSNPDTVSPTVTSTNFVYQTGQGAQFQFSEDVSNSVDPTDVVITNVAGGPTYTGASVAYSPSLNLATIGISPMLPDGNYTATLPPGSVTDPFGNPLQTPATLNFFSLSGDANRDRIVDIGDFALLSSQFNRDNRQWSQGDFNYDARTDLADFAILASQFGKTMPVPAGAEPPVASSKRLASPADGSADSKFQNQNLIADVMV